MSKLGTILLLAVVFAVSDSIALSIGHHNIVEIMPHYLYEHQQLKKFDTPKTPALVSTHQRELRPFNEKPAIEAANSLLSRSSSRLSAESRISVLQRVQNPRCVRWFIVTQHRSTIHRPMLRAESSNSTVSIEHI